MASKKAKKKPRTAKQKAASKRNIRKAIAAQGKKVHKAVRSKTRSHTMPKKKSSKRHTPGKKSFIDRIPILNNKTVQKVGFGLGMGVVAKQLIDLVAQFAPPAIANPLKQNQRIITLAVEAATEPISAVADIVLSSGTIQKTIGSMSNGNGMSSGGNQDMAGFA